MGTREENRFKRYLGDRFNLNKKPCESSDVAVISLIERSDLPEVVRSTTNLELKSFDFKCRDYPPTPYIFPMQVGERSR